MACRRGVYATKSLYISFYIYFAIYNIYNYKIQQPFLEVISHISWKIINLLLSFTKVSEYRV